MGIKQPDKNQALRVLEYLQRMEDFCLKLHRPELARDYHEAYAVMGLTIYGPLPSRWDMQLARERARMLTSSPAAAEDQPKTIPGWKRELLARPMRKVIGTLTRKEPGPYGKEEAAVYEILECRHEHGPLYWGQEPGRRRRCRLCAAANKKKAQQTERPAEDVEGRRA